MIVKSTNKINGVFNQTELNKNTKTGTEKFSDYLKNAINEANELKIKSDNLTTDFLTGKTDNLHEVMIASQKAEIALLFVTEVRNKVIEGYQEFAKMQI
ncbi:MAG: flagellar hook-basal body complex protein FliE [Fusobacteriaceae bacterium]|jgi:flagellar hook-basal body complex protein FliE|nr:flagellar hook-basal body complex subunit FliE [Fusobacteriales bacterium]MDN5303471.1 flagellar hook-basal body complex protein FliE [Fusobacteriaceae bacterium]